MIQGMNVTLSIYRRVEGASDAIGGAVDTTSLVYSGVAARISNLKSEEQQEQQGLETAKLYNCSVQPVTLDIRESDLVVPDNGSHSGKNFRVVGVQVDSILPNDPRAHLSLRLYHVDRAKALQ